MPYYCRLPLVFLPRCSVSQKDCKSSPFAFLLQIESEKYFTLFLLSCLSTFFAKRAANIPFFVVPAKSAGKFFLQIFFLFLSLHLLPDQGAAILTHPKSLTKPFLRKILTEKGFKDITRTLSMQELLKFFKLRYNGQIYRVLT
jgi:hypothetical protein